MRISIAKASLSASILRKKYASFQDAKVLPPQIGSTVQIPRILKNTPSDLD